MSLSDYEHVRWAESVLKNLDEETDLVKLAEIVLRAKDNFMYLSPPEKADIFVFLLGRNRSVDTLE